MRFIRSFWTDCKRMLTSVRFYLTVLIVFMLVAISVTPEIREFSESISIYQVVFGRGGIGAFLLAIASVAAVPFGLSYWEDKKHNYINSLEPRCGLSVYCWSHAATAALGAFVSVFAGYMLYILLLSFRLPLISAGELSLLHKKAVGGEDLDAFVRLIVEGHPWTSVIFMIAEEAGGYAFMAEFAFMLSARIDNVFVLLSTPIMLYYGSTFICQLLDLPGIFRWDYIMESGGILRYQFHEPYRLLWFVAEYFILLILLEAVCFMILLKRQRKNG